MMMKLMKFLVVALVAGGVCTPVASQFLKDDEGIDRNAIVCENPSAAIDEKFYSHLRVYRFENGQVVRIMLPTESQLEQEMQPKFERRVRGDYKIFASRIEWEGYG